MAKEIERKFLVSRTGWSPSCSGKFCRQGYLCFGPPAAVRVRIVGNEATLNIKSATTAITRSEFEYPIPIGDAAEMLDRFCQGHIIEKTRYEVGHEGLTWEIDVFSGANDGLIVAEVELGREDQAITLPPWVEREVSGDPRFLNTSLALHPYSNWRRDK